VVTVFQEIVTLYLGFGLLYGYLQLPFLFYHQLTLPLVYLVLSLIVLNFVGLFLDPSVPGKLYLVGGRHLDELFD
jgi:hypothetical protein